MGKKAKSKKVAALVAAEKRLAKAVLTGTNAEFLVALNALDKLVLS